jgi:hypothetical protein
MDKPRLVGRSTARQHRPAGMEIQQGSGSAMRQHLQGIGAIRAGNAERTIKAGRLVEAATTLFWEPADAADRIAHRHYRKVIKPKADLLLILCSTFGNVMGQLAFASRNADTGIGKRLAVAWGARYTEKTKG